MLCRKLKIDVVIPGCEPEIAILSRQKPPIEIPIVCQKHECWIGMAISSDACNRCQAWWSLYRLLMEMTGMPFRTWWGYRVPVVIKHVRRRVHAHLRIARNKYELEVFIAQVSHLSCKRIWMIVRRILGWHVRVRSFTDHNYQRDLGSRCTWFARHQNDAECWLTRIVWRSND